MKEQTKCCSGCGACGGGCGGCGLDSALSSGEKRLLDGFAVLPFQPLLRHRESGELLLPGAGLSERVAGAILSGLARRGLVDLQEELPLGGYDYSPYGEEWLRGSAALTARGQELLDDREFGGRE